MILQLFCFLPNILLYLSNGSKPPLRPATDGEICLKLMLEELTGAKQRTPSLVEKGPNIWLQDNHPAGLERLELYMQDKPLYWYCYSMDFGSVPVGNLDFISLMNANEIKFRGIPKTIPVIAVGGIEAVDWGLDDTIDMTSVIYDTNRQPIKTGPCVYRISKVILKDPEGKLVCVSPKGRTFVAGDKVYVIIYRLNTGEEATKPENNEGNSSPWFRVGMVLIIVGCVGGAVYLLGLMRKKEII